MQAILAIYLKSLLISAVVVLILSGLYMLGTISRNYDKPLSVRQNKIFDVLLIDILTIPILSFAVLAILIILKSRWLITAMFVLSGICMISKSWSLILTFSGHFSWGNYSYVGYKSRTIFSSVNKTIYLHIQREKYRM